MSAAAWLTELLHGESFLAFAWVSVVLSLTGLGLGAHTLLASEAVRRGTRRAAVPGWLLHSSNVLVLGSALLCVAAAVFPLARHRSQALQAFYAAEAYLDGVGSRLPVAVLLMGLASCVALVAVAGAVRMREVSRAQQELGRSRTTAVLALSHPSPRLDLLLVAIGCLALASFWFAHSLSEYARALVAMANDAAQDRTIPPDAATGLKVGGALSMLGVASGVMALFLAYLIAAFAKRARPLGSRGGTSGVRLLLSAGFVAALALAGSCVLLLKTTPLWQENTRPLPTGYSFVAEAEPIPEPLLALHGPDPVRPALRVEVNSSTARIDGAPVSPPELARILRSKRELWLQTNPGSPFPGRLQVEWKGSTSAMVLHEWLIAVRRAGYRVVDFVLFDHLALSRPVLGKLWAVRRGAVSIVLVGSSEECGATENPFPLALHPSASVALLQDFIEQRRAGLFPCVVVRQHFACPAADRGQHCLSRLDAPSERVTERSLDGTVQLWEVRLREQLFDVVRITDARRIHVWHQARTGQRIGTFRELEEALLRDGQHLLFAMNAGIFEPDFSPTGLLVSDGLERSPLNERQGTGNFYLEPNGVFAIVRHSPQRFDPSPDTPHSARVVPTTRFAVPEGSRLMQATQSGPLLLNDGVVHPAFEPDSESRAKRNAIGTDPQGDVYFVLSKERVTFFELAELFTHLGVRDALYLDGNLSTLYRPGIDETAPSGNFGPFVGVLREAP